MSVRVGETIEVQEVPLLSEKIQRHESSISRLELYLIQWRNSINAELYLRGYNNSCTSVKSWKDIETAKQEFPDLIEKFRKGEYTLHLYSNGEVNVEFK